MSAAASQEGRSNERPPQWWQQSLEKAFVDLSFQNHFVTLKGLAFQQFFADLMERRYGSDFHRVKPWGRRGDEKCDGYLKSQRKLFAVVQAQS